MLATPLLSRGPRSGQICYVTPAYWRSPEEGTKSKVATSPLPSRRPRRGWLCYVTPAFYGVPRIGDKIKSGHITPAFSGAHKWAEYLRNPCVLRGSQKRGQNQKWVHHPYFSGAHKWAELL